MISVANIIEESKLGGPQIRIVTVAFALKNKVNTTVIMPEANSEDFCTLCESLLVKYKTLWMSRITKQWMEVIQYVLFFPYEVIRLMLYFRKEKFNIIHVSGGSWQYKGIIAGKLTGNKVVWHLNDTEMPKLFRMLFMLFGRYADGYIFASERSKSYYKNLVSENIAKFTIPAPVDTKKFNPSVKYHGDELLISNWDGKIVIGMVANINPIKGLEVFIKAASRLNQELEDIVFVVVGAEYESQKIYIAKLRQLCKELFVNNIEFVGKRLDIRPLLSRFDIYVCSSLAESSPISVWEALAMEKPIVSTSVGDIPFYVRNGINGFILDVDDFVAMAKYLKVLILDREKRLIYGKNARKIALHDLDVSLCAQKHLSAYKKILGR